MAGVATGRKMTANDVSRVVLDCAFRVHSTLGPGLLGSTYQACLVQELRNAGAEVRTEAPLKLSGKPIGFLLNFNVVHLKDGIKRFVMGDNWN